MTVSGIYRCIPNPERKWWQFWKPRIVQTDDLQVFRVAG